MSNEEWCLPRVRQSASATASDAPRDGVYAKKHAAMHYFRKPSSLDEYMQLGIIVGDLLSPDHAAVGLPEERGTGPATVADR